MNRARAFHPILAAVLPVLSLARANGAMVAPGELAVPLIMAVCLALLPWIGLRLLLGHTNRSALLTSFALTLFFSYGLAYGFVRRNTPLCLLWAGLVLIAAVLLARTRRDFNRLTAALNGICLFLLIFNLAAFAPALARRMMQPENALEPAVRTDSAAGPAAGPTGSVKHPDIYFIILDGYARADVLQEIHHHDNRPFLNRLADNGFFVAERGRTNYSWTFLSLCTSLNMDYIQNLIHEPGMEAYETPKPAEVAAPLINASRVALFLKQRGYRIVTFSSGASTTDMMKTDVQMAPRGP